jgi:hypothetical protein
MTRRQTSGARRSNADANGSDTVVITPNATDVLFGRGGESLYSSLAAGRMLIVLSDMFRQLIHPPSSIE